MKSVPVTHKKKLPQVSSHKATTSSLKGVTKKHPSSVKVSHKPIAKKVVSPYTRKMKRYAKQGLKSLLLSPVFHSTVKMVSVAIVSTGLMYASYFFISKTFANEVVVSQSEIIARVAKLTTVPNELPYEVVRVQDEEDLQKQNPFYKSIEEGDYILMYKDMAVIYDLRNNVIKGIKRVE